MACGGLTPGSSSTLYALASVLPHARAYSGALMITAPGAQPMFVDSAATRNVLGIGVGSVTRSPMCRWCSAASAWESTTQPPARTRRARPREVEPSTICDGGQQRRGLSRRGDHPHAALAPIQQAAAIDAHGANAWQARELGLLAWT